MEPDEMLACARRANGDGGRALAWLTIAAYAINEDAAESGDRDRIRMLVARLQETATTVAHSVGARRISAVEGPAGVGLSIDWDLRKENSPGG